jgi:hypothetical protein
MKKLDINKVKQWYKMHLWSKEMVLDAVNKGAITQEEANEILGEA